MPACHPPTQGNPTMFATRSLLAMTLALCSVSALADVTLTVYTALEADQLKAYQQKFEQDTPGVKLRWVRVDFVICQRDTILDGGHGDFLSGVVLSCMQRLCLLSVQIMVTGY